MNARGRITAVLWLALVAACAWVWAHARVTTDLSAFLPRSASGTERLLLDQMRDGAAARLMLVGIEGASRADLARTSRRLAADLRASGLFSYVANGDEALSSTERAWVFEHRYLLSPTLEAGQFDSVRLRAALKQRLLDLASPLGSANADVLLQDPTGEALRVARALTPTDRPARYDGVWFARDKARALLLAQTRSPAFDAEAQGNALAALRAAFARAAVGAPRLLVSGPGVFAAQAHAVIARDAWRLSLIAALAVLAILAWVYRSASALVLLLLPVLTGLAAGVAAVALGFGFVHGITLGFGATLIGEAVDYPSYLFLQAARGRPVREAVATLWPTLRLAALTTVLGAATLLLSDFVGLSQLGVLTAVGVLAAAAVTRFVLPALATERFAPRRREALPPMLARAVRAAPRARPAALALIVLALAAIAYHGGCLWDDDLGRMSPVPASAKALDAALRAELGAPDVRYMIVVRAASAERALERSEAVGEYLEALVRDARLAGFDMAARYVPSASAQAKRQAALPRAAVLNRSLDAALVHLPFRPQAFAAFKAQVAQARRAPPLRPEDLHASALALKVHSLLYRSADRWTALIPLTGVRDAPAVAHALKDAPGGAVFLDLKADAERLVRGYRDSALRLTAASAAAIALLLLASLGELGAVARVMAPVAAAIAVTVALLALAGVPLTLFHLVSLLLVLGIGLNYALFFNRADLDARTRARTELSLVTCSATTLCGFGALAFSHTPVLHAIGVTVSLGSLLALLASAVFAQREARAESRA